MPKNNVQEYVNKVDASTFQVPENERHLYHVKIEVTQFDRTTGKRLSSPRIQCFGPKAFKTLVHTLKLNGYKLEILYDPTEFLAKMKEARKVSREQAIREKLMRELKEAGVIRDEKAKSEEEIRKELLAELEAKGMLKSKKKTAEKDKEPAGSTLSSEEPVSDGDVKEEELS